MKSSIFRDLTPRRFVEPVLAAIAIGALIVNGVLEVRNFQRLQETRLRVRANKRALIKIEETLLAVTNAETGQRGYVITGDDAYLEPYHQATPRIDGLLDELAKMTEANAAQQKLVAELRERITQKIDELEEVVNTRKEEGAEAASAIVLTDIGIRTMDRIRDLADQIRAEEHRALDRHEAAAVQAYRQGLLTSILSTAAGLTLVAGVIYVLHRSRLRYEQSARAIQIARDDLRITLASIGDGVISTNDRGEVAFLNGVAESLTGWTNRDAQGRPLEDVFVIINETTRQAVDNPAVRALREGIIVGLANHTLLIARDGRETPIDDSAAPIRGADGGIRGVVLVFRDVTDRRENESRLAEAAQQRSLDIRNLETALGGLRAAEQRFHLAMDAAEMGAWNFNPATQELVADERFWKLFTCSSQALDYEGFYAAVHPEDRERIREAVAESTRPDNPPPYAEEYRIVHPDGAVRWISAKGAAHFETVNGVRQLVSFDGTVADVTDRKLNEQALARLTADLTEADRRKNEFLAMLAHELRNPLAPIKNAVQLMATTPLDAETESLRAMMARQVEQLVHLIDDLIDVSRISRGKIKLRREPVDLTSVIEAAVEASQSMIKENGQTLRIETDSQRLVVYADPSRITQVVSNLLNNAAKYSDEGSRIELSVARQESEAVIVVRDDGIGIDPAELSTIFQMFSQIDTSIDRGQAGLGIGLTLVKSFVEMHGGEVTASSEGRGKGSVFTVRLPLSEKPLAEASRPQKVVRTPGRSFRVLVIDDQAALRLMLSKLVEKLGHQVESVSGGDEALASLGSFAPEVVISDISMPGMSGYELVRRLRSLPGAEGVYVVAMTGYGQATDRQAALDAGFDEHMVKPADMAQLEGLFARLSESWGKAE